MVMTYMYNHIHIHMFQNKRLVITYNRIFSYIYLVGCLSIYESHLEPTLLPSLVLQAHVQL